MRKKAYVIFFILVSSIFLISCNNYPNVSNAVDNYQVENVFINSNEEFELDIKQQFASSGINISKYELSSSNDEVASIKRNKIIGKKTGKLVISGVLYDKSKQTKYVVKVANVYVINPEDMIEVKTAEDLAKIKNNMSGHYILKSDIDLANYGSWKPIGVTGSEREFSGIFVNPEGYKIKNLTIRAADSILLNGNYKFCKAGLFFSITNAYIDGIILDNVDIDVCDFDNTYLNGSAGGIASSMLNSVIRNCHVSGTILAQYFSGGIIGSNSWGYILDCSFEGTIKTINDTTWARNNEVGAGGIAGFSGTNEKQGLISNCNVKATIIGHVSAGGIVGTMMKNHNIYNCNFQGSVKGEISQDEQIGRFK